LAAVARPLLRETITPLVNARFAASCGGQCRPCQSFVRKYTAGERLTHGEHFDIQSLVSFTTCAFL
jgi:hypothetical protein